MADASTAGRARGRARGRGEGSEGVVAPGPPSVAGTSEVSGASAMPRGGIAARGGGQVDLKTRMERLQASRARRMEAIVTPKTRPENISSSVGQSGQPVDLVSNFFRIQGGPTWCMYEYHIDFEPEIDFLSLRGALVRAHKDKIGEVYSFNGANLITPKNIGQEEVWQSKRDSDGAMITLRVRRTGEVSPDTDEAIRILDIAIRQMQGALELKQSKRDFFDPKAAITMPNYGMTIWPGYAMTITKYETELLLNMDIIHRVMRTDTVYDMLKQIFGQARQHGGDPKEAVAKELIGIVVLTKYNNKTHTIDDILWPPENCPATTFERKGEQISIADYMRTQYSINVQDMKQPLLVTRPRKMARRLKEEGRVDKLIPELCYMTGLTETQRSDFRLMKEFGEITRLSPQNRMKRYMDFGRRVTNCPAANQILTNWNLKLEAQPLRLKGRLLPPVELGTGAAGATIRPDVVSAEWANAIKSMKACDAVPLVNWVLIYPRRDEQIAREFAEAITRISQSMGIQASPPKPLAIDNTRADGYKGACQQASTLPNVSLIACILQRKDRQIYEAIKKYTLVDVGIPSQCVVTKTLQKGMMSVCTKIMQQVCVKLGGALWKVPIPCKRAMICGFDTYHDSSARGKSVGGFVATIDEAFTKFFSRSFQHETRGELSHHMVPCLAEAIKTFHSRNSYLPEVILFYRDGVADNQLQAVHDTEVQQLRDVARQFGPDYNPKLAVIVVQKRIRPRFFAIAGPNIENPKPGTIIDNTVTNPRAYDFYVIAQAVRQGTVTPTRYNIIFEGTTLKADHHHQLAYRLSHLYYNWPGTIRVVAPCHYAHKLAFLVGQHVHTETHRNLWTKLYYL